MEDQKTWPLRFDPIIAYKVLLTLDRVFPNIKVAPNRLDLKMNFLHLFAATNISPKKSMNQMFITRLTLCT